MTDRLKGCVVAFEKDIREDDAEGILNAIRMIKGVADVSTKKSGHDDFINRQQIKVDLQYKILDLFKL